MKTINYMFKTIYRLSIAYVSGLWFFYNAIGILTNFKNLPNGEFNMWNDVVFTPQLQTANFYFILFLVFQLVCYKLIFEEKNDK